MQATTILCLGLSHHTAPVELREQLSCSLTALKPHLAGLTAVSELVLISTCNRIELYAVAGPSLTCPRTEMLHLLSDVQGVPVADFIEHTYTLADHEALDHLLRVAAGLDSLVLGEPQILGQVTDAYMTAVSAKTVGPILDALFKTAIRTGKRARTETNISSNPASVSSVSIALAQRVLGNLSEKRTTLLGMGQMGKLALKALRHRGLDKVSIVNRTVDKAAQAVANFDGTAYGLDGLCQAIAEADVFITAANTPAPIVDTNCIAERNKPLVIVDIAVPRNVDTAVAQLPGVHLFDVDDLQATLDESLAARQAEVPHVEAIINDEIDSFNAQLRELMIKPVIVGMRRKADQIREAELERTLRYLGELDPQTLAHIQHFSRSLVNKLLHEPTIRLKAKANENEADDYAATVRDLFGLAEHI